MVTRERSDEELLSARDPEAFEAFHLPHVLTLLGHFARRTQDPELAADLTAETFAAAPAPAARDGPPGSDRPRRGRDRGAGGLGQRDGAFEPLTEDQRSAVRAHVIDERGYDEIARAHHTTEAVIRKRISRGLAAVRRGMGPRPSRRTS